MMSSFWTAAWGATVLRNSVGDWMLAGLAFLITFTALLLVRSFVAARRRRWAAAAREQPAAIEIAALLAERTSRLFIWGVAVAFGCAQLSLPPHVARAVDIVTIFIFWYQMGRWGMAAVRYAVERRRRRNGGPDPAVSGSIEIILFAAGLVVWTTVFLVALDNLGVAIRPLLAGLGIGGIAVALAVQAVLGDLLASMSIALDKPFAVGDALVIDGFNGTVEHIGVKSTRLRSVSGEQIVMSNADVLKSRLRNYGRLRERRSAFELTVTYDTAPAVLREIPEAVRRIVEGQPSTRFDRCHLMMCAQTGLTFEIVYFVTVPEFKVYADVQQAINIAILERFRELGVQFATPVLAPMPSYPKTGSAASAPGAVSSTAPMTVSIHPAPVAIATASAAQVAPTVETAAAQVTPGPLGQARSAAR